jgi:hypothetical protein
MLVGPVGPKKRWRMSGEASGGMVRWSRCGAKVILDEILSKVARHSDQPFKLTALNELFSPQPASLTNLCRTL